MSSTADTWEKSALQVERERSRARRANRSRLIAVVSAVVFFGLLGWIITSSPGWTRVQETFFSWDEAKESFPAVRDGFWLNIKLFMTIEPIVLIVGLLLALARGTQSPIMFPVRAVAVAYVDVFRGVPTVLLIFLIGFGVPALDLQGAPTSLFWLGVIALSMSYSAYVAEVIRAGILSVHPSQRAAARSLGLSQGLTMRTVVLPQAFRRVAAPLLNDFVSLQKDTALVAVLGLVEALRAAQIYSSFHFNYTSIVVAACFFIVITIPLARFTDYVGLRAIKRQQAGAVV